VLFASTKYKLEVIRDLVDNAENITLFDNYCVSMVPTLPIPKYMRENEGM